MGTYGHQERRQSCLLNGVLFCILCFVCMRVRTFEREERERVKKKGIRVGR